jgi:putative membrane protein
MSLMRTPLLVAGSLVLSIAWLGLPLISGDSGFVGHMGVHMGVVALAAPLLAIGCAGSRWDPTPHAPALFAPMLATLLEFMVVWGWHAPALHLAARTSTPVLALEQLSFLAAGLLVWLAAFGRGAKQSSGVQAAGILALFLTSMHMTLLGALLALSPRLLFDPAICGTGSLAPLDDQHLGGVLMLLTGGASYLAGALVLVSRLLGDPGVRLGPWSR